MSVLEELEQSINTLREARDVSGMPYQLRRKIQRALDLHFDLGKFFVNYLGYTEGEPIQFNPEGEVRKIETVWENKDAQS